MSSNTTKSILAFGLGFASGWGVRSLADSPQGVGVRLLEIAMHAKERIAKWAAAERERLEDMMAEARAKVDQEAAPTNGVGTNGVAEGNSHPMVAKGTA